MAKDFADISRIETAEEMNATNKRESVAKLMKAWESKNAKRTAKGAGLSLVAVSLAACTVNDDLEAILDRDGDGWANDIDAFPDNASEWLDTDGDGTGDNSDPFPTQADNDPQLFALTTNTDEITGTASADTFNAGLQYTPGGNDRVNSLQSEDDINGGAGVDTINITLGQNNDNGGTEVTPLFTSIEVVNVRFTSTSGNAEGGFVNELNMEFSAGTETMNVTRLVGDDTAQYSVIGMEGATDTLSVSGAPNDASLEFNYREGVLESGDDTLALDISGARLTALDVTIGNRADGAEDEEFSFETVNITTGGGYADVDTFTFAVDGDDSNWDALAQDVTLTLGVDTEFNAFNMPGADSLAISLGANDLHITADETDNDDGNTDANGAAVFGLDDADDGMSVGNLNSLTITGSGDALLNGIDGEVVATEFDAPASRETADSLAERYTENNTGLTIDASAMTGRLMANISGNLASDDDSSLVSGSGDDYIDYMGSLNHSATTGAGNDYVEADAMMGLGRIDTGSGHDVVVTGNMTAFGDDINAEVNGGRDAASSITTGSGNDRVTVEDMGNAIAWDDNLPDDANADDHYVTIGTAIDTGEGDDVVQVSELAEQASITTGTGNDIINADTASYTAPSSQSDPVVMLRADTTDVREVVATNEAVTNEVTVRDFTGASIDTGAGDDVFNWVEAPIGDVDGYDQALIVEAGAADNVGTGEDRGGAHLIMGDGTDVMNVTALDTVTIAEYATINANIAALAASSRDVEELIYGVETLNATVANQVLAATAAISDLAENDDDTNNFINIDVERFDSALTNINLTSLEDVVRTNLQNANEQYEAGTQANFDLVNLRDQTVKLVASEATGVTNGQRADDTAQDVVLNVNMLDAEGFDTTFTLEIAGRTDAVGSADFDLRLNVQQTYSDQTLDSAVANDDDAGNIENVVLNITDGSSHAFDMGGFGDAANTNDVVDAVTSGSADTSLTVTGSAAGESIVINNTNAKAITADIAANVSLTVTAENHYTILTGSGNDVLDMRATNVQANSTATPLVDETDRINAGAGRDRMIVDESDNLGTDGALGTAQAGTLQNDDDWRHLTSIEDVTSVANNSGVTQQIVLDEDALATGVQTLTVTEAANATITEYTLRLTFGDDFDTAGFTGTLAGVNYSNHFITDMSAMDAGRTTLRIDNRDDDTDLDNVNTLTAVNAAGGVVVDAVSLGADASINTWHVTVSNDANTTIASTDLNGGTVDSGDVVLNVATTGHYDNIVLVDAAETNGNNPENYSIEVRIDRDWIASNSTFVVDGRAILDQDGSPSTGGATIYSVTGEQASGNNEQALDLTGTQNNDIIVGGDHTDTISGQNGSDVLQGDHIREDLEQVVRITFDEEYQEGDTITFNIDGTTFALRVQTNDVTGKAMADALASILNGDGTVTGNSNIAVVNYDATIAEAVSAVANAGASVTTRTGVIDITGAIVNGIGDRFESTAGIFNQGIVQTLTIDGNMSDSRGANADGADIQFDVVYDNETYTLTGSVATNSDLTIITGLTALQLAVEAEGGTLTAATVNGNFVLTLTPAAGTPSNIISGYSVRSIEDAGSVVTDNGVDFETIDEVTEATLTATLTVVGGDNQPAPTVEVIQLITDNTVYAADVLTGGADADTFNIYKSGMVVGGQHVNIDHITDMDFNSDTIVFGGYWAHATGTELADRTVINSIVNQNAADGSTIEISLTGSTLEQAVADLFQVQGVFAAGDLNETNSAGLFTYGGRDYVIAVGDEAGGFGADDFIVDVTGYTGTLSLDRGDIAPERVQIGLTPNVSSLTLERTPGSDAFDDSFGFHDGVTTNGSEWRNYELGEGNGPEDLYLGSDRVKGLTEVDYQPGQYIIVPASFSESGDDKVHDEQFEVYIGTYVDGVFEITGNDGNTFDLTDATHTMILYDNDTRFMRDPQFIEGLVMEGVYEEEGDNGLGEWVVYRDGDIIDQSFSNFPDELVVVPGELDNVVAYDFFGVEAGTEQILVWQEYSIIP